MKNSRFVFDTNTLISAVILPRSVSAFSLEKAEKIGFLYASQTTFDEFLEVVYRPKFDKYLSLEARHNFIDRFRSLAIFLSVTKRVEICRDPKDNQFLDLALASEAHYIITGDQDLLVLTPFNTTQIITPAEFLNIHLSRLESPYLDSTLTTTAAS